tara:strand:- start:220 stop:759 length:540 start_codon:yes stop_codon:yes gene_type:complete
MNSVFALAAGQDIYKLSFKNIEGKNQEMKDYRGKTLLIVNTASQCGYTKQYSGLEKLYQAHKNKGLVVIGFPSNSFKQELDNDAEVAKFCKMRFGVKFPLASITPVKGPNRHPIYSYLINNTQQDSGQDVSWNFEKFVVGPDGKVKGRFSSRIEPDDKKLLAAITSKTTPKPPIKSKMN